MNKEATMKEWANIAQEAQWYVHIDSWWKETASAVIKLKDKFKR